MSRRGLPETVRMRHDEHYVEALAASAGTPVGRMVPIDLIDPNPNQPRQVMGDLSELMASIAEKGIIEPLVVRQRGDRFQIIAGERRYQAAVQVGLSELPGVIRDADDTEMMEIALVENLQRKDLTRVRRGRGAARRSRRAAATRTRCWRDGWGSPARRSPNRSRCRRCRTRSGTFVGWPTFPLSHCFYR